MASEFLEAYPTPEFVQFDQLNPGFLSSNRFGEVFSSWEPINISERAFTRPTEAHYLMYEFFRQKFAWQQLDTVGPISLHDGANETYQMLAKSVNSTVTPVDAPIEITADLDPVSLVGTCSRGERRFFAAFLANSLGLQDTYMLAEGRYASVYFDGDGEPVLIRKYEADRSALSLKPLNLNNVWIPGGTIFAIQSKSGIDAPYSMFGDMTEQDILTKDGTKLRVMDIDDIASLLPRRLSLWANTDPEQLLLHTQMRKANIELIDEINETTREERLTMIGCTLADFAEVVKSWKEQG